MNDFVRFCASRPKAPAARDSPVAFRSDPPPRRLAPHASGRRQPDQRLRGRRAHGTRRRGAVGVNHTLNGIVYKTFTEPLPKVKRATLTALKQMEITVDAVEKTKQGEVIKAKASNRAIEVEFEALTPKTTRMRVVADSDGFTKDSATATEIILQTERALPAT
jgi:hypothetical protein